MNRRQSEIYNQLPQTYQLVINDLISSNVPIEDLGLMLDTMLVQHQKGLIKYNKTIDEATGYNWLTMAREEYVDMLVYLKKAELEGK